MNADEPAAAYHHSVRLLYQISNHRLNYNKHTEIHAFGQSGQTRKLSFWKQNVFYFSEIQNRSVFYLMGGIPKSKCSCYIAQPSMLCHNYVKFWQISSQWARLPKLLHICVQWTQEKWHNFTWLICLLTWIYFR